MTKTENEIMQELEFEAEKLRTKVEVGTTKGISLELPVNLALADATKEIYAGLKDVGLVTAAGTEKASYVLVDYSCTSNLRVLWAYAGNAWRYKIIDDSGIQGIAKVVMEADSIDASWTDSSLTFVRCWKKY